MNLLWITNIIFPDACEELGIKAPVAGGWMLASAKRLLENPNISLAVATVYSGKEFRVIDKNGVKYYLLPSNVSTAVKYNKSLEPLWKEVALDFIPDVVHIHGTEYTHGLAYIRACGADNVVVSIQGLVAVYHRYYDCGMTFWEQFKSITCRDILRMDTLFQQKAKFFKRGLHEIEYIKSVKHIIGRTSWDKAHVLAINPDAQYHFCNETLREVFYKSQWSYDTCEKYSMFLSQAGYPIKGLHQVIKAMPLVLRNYPKAKMYIAGPNITDRSSLKARLKQSGYAKYISSLITQYRLEDKICFTGTLNAQEICQQYLKTNVFVCPSSIENSPNSLGEAQLLGVPCIASYVGGVPDMVPNEACGQLYRFEEAEMLAGILCKYFERSTWDNAEMQAEAANRHSVAKNSDELVSIYHTI